MHDHRMWKGPSALEVENDELAKLVDTNDEWIVTRTGISSRHVAVGETGTDPGRDGRAGRSGLVAGRLV